MPVMHFLIPSPFLSLSVCGKVKRNIFAFPGDHKAATHTKEDKFPWMVSIISVSQVNKNIFKSLLCVGSLINDRDILTSATCVYLFQPQELMVTLSSHPDDTNTSNSTTGVQLQVPVDSITIHPDFVKRFATSGRVLTNDIAVVRLANAIDLENDDIHIAPVCLHEPITNRAGEKHMMLSGWQYPAPGSSSLGKASSHSTDFMQLIPSEECKQYFARIVQLDSKSITCTPTPPGVCYLERGSPLLFEYSSFTYQHALVSLSRQIADCSTTRKNKVPTVLTLVQPYLMWIKQVTDNAHWCWAPYQAIS